MNTYLACIHLPQQKSLSHQEIRPTGAWEKETEFAFKNIVSLFLVLNVLLDFYVFNVIPLQKELENTKEPRFFLI